MDDEIQFFYNDGPTGFALLFSRAADGSVSVEMSEGYGSGPDEVLIERDSYPCLSPDDQVKLAAWLVQPTQEA